MSAIESIDTAARTRELASRESDGVHVLLLWRPRDDALTVLVEDSRAGQRFELAVDRRRALDTTPTRTPPNTRKPSGIRKSSPIIGSEPTSGTIRSAPHFSSGSGSGSG